MGADYKNLAIKTITGTWWYTKNIAVNSLRRVLILGRHTLGAMQQRRVNKAMRQLGLQFFQALERGETNPLVVSEVSAAVTRAKDLKEGQDKNAQAIAAIRDRIRAAWRTELPPVPAPAAPETPEEPGKPVAAEDSGDTATP
jgi:hypothetical protein